MRFSIKPVAIALAATGLLSYGFVANAASSQQQVNNLRTQINALSQKINNAKHHNSSNMMISDKYVATNPVVLNKMMSSATGVSNEYVILNARKNGLLNDHMTYLGGKLKGSVYYEDNTHTGTTRTQKNRAELNEAKVSITSLINPWTTIYTDVNTSAGTGSSADGTVALNQAFIMFGNLKVAPVYVLLGKKDVDFGDFARTTYFTKPLTNLAFAANATQAVVGYDEYGLHLDFSAFNGTTQTDNTQFVLSGGSASSRTLMPNNSYHVSNFAVNGSYGFGNAYYKARLGGGYLNGTGFVSPENASSPAFDFFGKLNMGNLGVYAEYVQTVHSFDGTFKTGDLIPNASAVTISVPDQKVRAWNFAGSYALSAWQHATKVALSMSQIEFGSRSANKRVDQFVASYMVNVHHNVSTGIEYAYDGVENGSTATKYSTYQVSLVGTAYF